MNLHVVCVEYSLVKPDPSLGDEQLNPLFHAVSARCPVLHLFGYTHIHDGDNGDGNNSPSGARASVAAERTISPSHFQQRSICAHIHGVYPYFMVLRHDSRVSAMQFGAQLESVAIKVLGLFSSTTLQPVQLLHHVDIVRRLPFYGYHTKPKSFYKISVIDPAMVSKLARLLEHTTEVGGRRWQTYEAHTPYHFQFMLDYGMKGMSPFYIPACTARSPLEKEIESSAEMRKKLHITTVMPPGEPSRLTRAEVEVDVDARELQQRAGPAEPGENLLSVRRSVRQYFAGHGVDDALRREAVTDMSDRNCTVRDVQRNDSALEVIRQREIKYLNARAEEPLSHMTSTLQAESDRGTTFSSPSGRVGESLTLRLMEEMHGDRTEAARSPLSVSSSSSSALPAPLATEQQQQQQAEEEERSLLFSEENNNNNNNDNDCDDLQEAPKLRDKSSLIIGDSVALFDVSTDDRTLQTTPLLAKIVRMDDHTVRLRWYITLRETHLADTQRELEKQGRWLSAHDVLDERGNALETHEELLLGDVEDDNPIDVLKQSVRVTVRHSYCGGRSPGLLCRYNYHVSEQRLSAIEPALREEVVALPALLSCFPAVGGVRAAGVVDEDKELLASSSSSTTKTMLSSSSASSLSSSLFSSLVSSAALESHPTLSLPVLRPSTDGVNLRPPLPLRRSVSDHMQQAAQSQLSLLLSRIGTSPSPRATVHPVTSLSDADAGHDDIAVHSGPSSSSPECIDPNHFAFLRKIRETTSRLQPCDFIGDIPRNFRWTYDEGKNCMVVSAATWPFDAPSSATTITTTPTDTSKMTLGPTTTGEPNKRQSSVPLLLHIAPSQRTPIVHQSPPEVKPKWKPHMSPNTSSRSVDKCSPYTTCDLRVMCVEVLIHRQSGRQHVAQEEILAVGLGRTSSSKKSMGAALFCVRAENVNVSRLQQPFSGVVDVHFFPSESHLLQRVRQELCCYDPDIILSWEGSKYGISFLALRYSIVLGRSLTRDISRFLYRTDGTDGDADDEEDKEKELINDRIVSGKEDVGMLSPSPSSLPSSSASVFVSLEDNDGDLHDNARTSVLTTTTTTTTSTRRRGRRGNSLHGHIGADDMIKRLTRRFGGSVRIKGRISIDLGRQLRKELKLPSHTLQMVHKKLFHSSLPYFTDIALSKMYTSSDEAMRRVSLSVLLSRIVSPHRIAQHLNFYTRVVEFSRMYGILFNEVLTRGSQYRVEATLHRMAKPLGYAMLSPSIESVHKQPRLVSMPLIMEPRSGFYKDDPIVVLDFRSLYPSIIIAYNICYSTCLGKVSKNPHDRLGVVTSYKQPDSLLLQLLAEDDKHPESHQVTFAPNGCMFLSPKIRQGVLPQMLSAILDTRFEVLAALKHVAQPCGDKHMQRVLQEQQTAIKLLANTTYGYTAASFTGRMPCVDVADAIVMLGRQTLERAICLINGHPKWNAEVVYGDTDSLFVRLPGRTKEEAFLFGKEMAKEVSFINPAPIQLEFEKILFPTLLLVKKRYVGYAYFKPEQKEPQFVAKGIETVRRDQCPATSSLAESMIRLLFSGASNDMLRARFCEEVSKLQRGICNPSDCIFRRAVKLGRYHHHHHHNHHDGSDAHIPAGAHLARSLLEKDITRTPYWGERMPYIVIQSMTSTRLRDQVVHPSRLLSLTESPRIDHEYYIKHHIIPTLDRIFCLVGVSVASWYAQMPKRRACHSYFELGMTKLPVSGKKSARSCHDAILVDVDTEESTGGRRVERFLQPQNNLPCHVKKGTLDAYFQQTLCAVCLEKYSTTTSPDPPICIDCLGNRAKSVLTVVRRRFNMERHLQRLETACRRCIGSCGEAGGPKFLMGEERDMEDMHFAIPHHVAAASSARNGEESVCCLSIDCHLSFEKRHVFLVYSQLMALESYLTRL